MPNVHDLAMRSRGVFLSASVGDALGWPQEQNSKMVGGNRQRHVEATPDFRAWRRYNGSRFLRYVDHVDPGGYSDDTQLLLATGRALQWEDWFVAFTRRELPMFPLYSRGAGGATLRACRSWAYGLEPWSIGQSAKSRKDAEAYFGAGGNGVAMRIAPHVIMHARLPIDDLVACVVKDGIATHGHPRALVGAAAHAVALHLLVTADSTLEFGHLPARVRAAEAWQSLDILLKYVPSGWLDSAVKLNPNFSNSWTEAVGEMLEMLSLIERVAKTGTRGNDLKTLDVLGVFDRSRNGAGTISAAAAIYLASRNAPRPMSGLLRSAFLKNADTDTLASMTASLLGALHGGDWLGNLVTQVQDRRYIEWLSDDITARALGEESPNLSSINPVELRSIREFKMELGETANGNSLQLPDARHGRVIDSFELETLGKSCAHRWIIEVEEQSLFIDRVIKATESRARSGLDESEPTGGNAAVDIMAEGGAVGRFVGLTLRVNDLNVIERFYSETIGIGTERKGEDELLVGGAVRFFFDPRASFGMSVVLLVFEVPDIFAVARRCGDGAQPDRSSLRLTDPAGHDLQIIKIRS